MGKRVTSRAATLHPSAQRRFRPPHPAAPPRAAERRAADAVREPAPPMRFATSRNVAPPSSLDGLPRDEPLRQRESHPPRCSGPALPRMRRRREREGEQGRLRGAEARGGASAADALLQRLRRAAHGLTRRRVREVCPLLRAGCPPSPTSLRAADYGGAPGRVVRVARHELLRRDGERHAHELHRAPAPGGRRGWRVAKRRADDVCELRPG